MVLFKILFVFVIIINYCGSSTIDCNTNNAAQKKPRNIIDSSLKDFIYNNIYFIIFTARNQSGLVLQHKNYTEPNIDDTKVTKVILHGWRNDRNSEMPQKIKDAYLNETDYNIIIVDWSKISGFLLYPIPASSIAMIGGCIADFLMRIYCNVFNSNLNVHIVGHSLGSHVAAFTGRKLKESNYTLVRVTGLDPANPLIFNGLNKKDANFVDVIHTTSGTVGKGEDLGHADFYPNGGAAPQPGCSLFQPFSCSHSKGWEYFVDSIIDEHKYLAYQCDTFDDFKKNKCKNSTYMGEGVSTDSRGMFYLKTD